MKSYIAPALMGTVAVIQLVQPAIALTPPEVSDIARKVTVRVDGAAPGTGIIVNKEGNTYTVLTNYHVVAESGAYTVQTSSGKSYQVKPQSIKQLGDVDLAIFQFSSSDSYEVANFSNSDAIAQGITVHVAGWASPDAVDSERAFSFSSGTVSRRITKPKNGYALVYSNIVKPGMSGGAVLNEDGRVVGVTGLSSQDISTGATDFLGIPINTYFKLAKIPTPPITRANPKPARKDAPPVAAAPSTAEDFYKQGQLKDSRKDYKGAVASYDRAIAIKPRYVEAYVRRGQTYISLKEVEKALADINKAIEINPRYGLAYSTRGNAYMLLKEYQKAESEFNRGIEVEPQNPDVYISRGYFYADRQDQKKAISDLDKAVEINPKYAPSYASRGFIYYWFLNETEKGIADLNRAVEIDPSPKMFIARGMTYNSMGDKLEALKDLREAARLHQERGETAEYLETQDLINWVQTRP